MSVTISIAWCLSLLIVGYCTVYVAEIGVSECKITGHVVGGTELTNCDYTNSACSASVPGTISVDSES